MKFKQKKNGIIEIDMQKDEEVIFYSGDVEPDFTIMFVKEQKHLCNYFGSKKPWRLYNLPIE